MDYSTYYCFIKFILKINCYYNTIEYLIILNQIEVIDYLFYIKTLEIHMNSLIALMENHQIRAYNTFRFV